MTRMTATQKKAFLAALPTMNIKAAYRASGTYQNLVYAERAEDPAFEARVHAIISKKQYLCVERKSLLSRDELAARKAAAIRKAVEKMKARQAGTPKTVTINGCTLTRRACGRCSAGDSCAHYWDCLGEAARHDWGGWTAKPSGWVVSGSEGA